MAPRQNQEISTTKASGTSVASVEFLYFCTNAFLDIEARPCVLGMLDYIASDEFPYSRSSITIAAALRFHVGNVAHITITLGEPDRPQLRWGHFAVHRIRDNFGFVALKTLTLYFNKPQTLVARVYEYGHVLASRSIPIVKP
jgi:hypothetical protein